MLVRTCLVVLLLLVIRPPAAAADAVFGFELTGALSAYDMSSFNDSLTSFNEATGTAFGEISSGLGVGGNFRIWMTPRWLMRLGLQNWSAATESQGYTFDVSAWSFQIGVAYFPDLHTPFRTGLGLGFDNLTLHGGLEGPDVDLKPSGSGFGGHGTIEAMVPMGRQWSGIVTLGYRIARLDVVKLDEQQVGIEPDYTGPYVQLGLAFDGR